MRCHPNHVPMMWVCITVHSAVHAVSVSWVSCNEVFVQVLISDLHQSFRKILFFFFLWKLGLKKWRITCSQNRIFFLGDYHAAARSSAERVASGVVNSLNVVRLASVFKSVCSVSFTFAQL